jgi:hypothetical protein
VVVEEVKGGKEAPSRPKYTKKGRKQAVSHTSWLKNAVFCLKVLNKILPRCFLRNTLNLKVFVT